jgi:hypothetical protein
MTSRQSAASEGQGMVQFLGVITLINPCHHAADDECTKRKGMKLPLSKRSFKNSRPLDGTICMPAVPNQWTRHQVDSGEFWSESQVVRKCEVNKSLQKSHQHAKECCLLLLLLLLPSSPSSRYRTWVGLSCVGRGLTTGRSPVQAVLSTV